MRQPRGVPLRLRQDAVGQRRHEGNPHFGNNATSSWAPPPGVDLSTLVTKLSVFPSHSDRVPWPRFPDAKSLTYGRNRDSATRRTVAPTRDRCHGRNDRLAEPETRINNVDELLSGLRSSADDVLSEGDFGAIREMIVSFMTTHIDSAQRLYRLFYIYQYPFSHDDIETIRGHIEHLEKTHEDHPAQTTDEQREAFLLDVYGRTSILVDEMTRVSHQELTAVANRLRESCSA